MVVIFQKELSEKIKVLNKERNTVRTSLLCVKLKRRENCCGC